ncbi:MAG: pilus assembly protein PilM [Acidobacteriota bacterium]
MTSSRDHIDKILLSGGSARVTNLDHFLAETFNCEVQFLNPFTKVQVPAGKFSPEQVAEIAPAVAIAVGLALRKAG